MTARPLRLRGGTADLLRHVFRTPNESRALTTKETQLLAYLAERGGTAVSREDLLVHLWGYAPSMVTRTVDVTVRRLRAKVEVDPGRPDHILTRTGEGYVFLPLAGQTVADEPEPDAAAPASPPPRPERRTNIADEAAPFVGRDADIARIDALFEQSRVVTVVGPGGMGKTRLARRYALDRAASLSGGAWFLAMANARTREGLLGVSASVLGVAFPDAPTPEAVDRLARAVASRGPVLLVLDNVEQAVAEVATMLPIALARAPEARFLVTSREPLRIAAERRHVLPPLETPDAVRLFVQRARESLPDFEPGDAERRVLDELVERLDGTPLAIELAAARAGVLTPSDLLARLSDPLRLLRQGARDGDDRHSTVRKVIDWSWGLLDPAERAALAQCTVFRAPFTMEAAEEVLALPDARSADEALQALRDKSLVRTVQAEPGEPLRVRLYETVRHYAAEHLDAEARAEAEDRHAAWFLRAGEADAASLAGAAGVAARRRLQRALPELLAVHERFRERRPVHAVRAALAVAPVMTTRGPLEQTRALLDDAVELSRHRGPDLVARALLARGIAGQGHDASGARTDLERAQAQARVIQAVALEAEAVYQLGLLALRLGDTAEAAEQLDAARVRFEAVGDRLGVGRAEGTRAHIHYLHDRPEEALALLERALAVARAHGAALEEARLLGNRGIVHMALGADAEAHADHAAAAALNRAAGNRAGTATNLGNLGILAADRGRLDDALALFHECMSIHREVGNRRGEGGHLGNVGLIHVARGDLVEGRAWLERGAALNREQGSRPALGSDLGWLGFLDHLRGDATAGRAQLEEALALVTHVGDGRLVQQISALLAVCRAPAGPTPEATATLDAAEHRLASGAAPGLATLVDVLRGFVALAAGDGADARARLENAHRPSPRGRPPVDEAIEVRAAAKLLQLHMAG